jgi:hypothetical protein
MSPLELTDEMKRALRALRASRPRMSDAEEREDGVMYYGSIGGGFMITLDGRLLEEDWDEETLTEVIDPKQRLLALVIASEHMPAIAELLPSRPAGARDCALCSGVGRWSPAPPHNLICGACSGVGWYLEPAG